MRPRRLHACSSGAAAVEVALILLPLLMMSFGAVEFGRALWIRHRLSNAVAEGERILLLSGDPFAPEAADAVANRIRASIGPDSGSMSLTVRHGAWDGGRMVVVRVEYPVSLLLPAVRTAPFTLSAERVIPF